MNAHNVKHSLHQMSRCYGRSLSLSRYGDLLIIIKTKFKKKIKIIIIADFPYPSYVAPWIGVTHFEFVEKLYRSW